MSLFSELKRRNVLRVVAAYLVVGWLLLQVADIVFGFIGVPDWVGKVLISLLVLGFVPTIAIAWIFERTPNGVKRDQNQPQDHHAQTAGRRLDYITIGAVVLLALITFWQVLSPPATQSPDPVTASDTEASASSVSDSLTPVDFTDGDPGTESQPPADPSSIAVLPFADLSPQGDQAYFGDGIAEELLNALVRIDGLEVAGRTASFAFRDSNADLKTISERLRVAHILEGSVRKAGDRVRITAQLINAEDGFHLWSDTYDRTLDDIFAIQDEITAEIVDALRENLPGLSAPLDDATGTDSVEAYNTFLQGRYFLHKRGRENIRRAIELLEEAVRTDPGFADAHAQLARALSVGWGDDDLPRALAEAEMALALAPDSAMALMALASAVEEFPDRAREGLAAIERSLELRPDLAEAHHLRASYAFRLEKDLETCLEHEHRAAELDPTAAIYPIWIGFCELGLGNVDTGIGAMQAGHSLSPTGESLFLVAFSMANVRDGESALKLLETDPARAELEPHLETILRANVDALAGRTEAAQSRLQALGDLDKGATFAVAAAWPYLIAQNTELASDILQMHAEDPFLVTFSFLSGYLPDSVNLEAADYHSVMAGRNVPYFDHRRTEDEP